MNITKVKVSKTIDCVTRTTEVSMAGAGLDDMLFVIHALNQDPEQFLPDIVYKASVRSRIGREQ